MTECQSEPPVGCTARRLWLRKVVGIAIIGLSDPSAAEEPSPSTLPPQPGDQLTVSGERSLIPADVMLNAPPLLVYPRDPLSGVVRDGSRLNQILLIKLDIKTLDDTTRVRAAEGIVAYSGICTHAACAVSEWKGETRHLLCPCHNSEYDVSGHANVVAGPAPRPLPALPLSIAGQYLIVQGAFTAKVGLKKL